VRLLANEKITLGSWDGITTERPLHSIAAAAAAHLILTIHHPAPARAYEMRAYALPQHKRPSPTSTQPPTRLSSLEEDLHQSAAAVLQRCTVYGPLPP
jgi:hypothetical protein